MLEHVQLLSDGLLRVVFEAWDVFFMTVFRLIIHSGLIADTESSSAHAFIHRVSQRHGLDLIKQTAAFGSG